MNPRPIHRSRLFWLGLPGFFFLLWLWLGTRSTLAMANWSQPTKAFSAITSDGVLQLAWTTVDDPGIAGLSGKGLTWEITETVPGPLLPPAVIYRDHELITGSHQRLLNLAHWLILLTYTLLWLAATIAWHHRKRRKSQLLHP